MKHNSNNFERYFSTKNTKIFLTPPVAVFLTMKHNSNNFEIYLATKKGTILPRSLVAIFGHENNSNNFEIYLATKKHYHTPPANLQCSGAHNREQVHATYCASAFQLEHIAPLGMGGNTDGMSSLAEVYFGLDTHPPLFGDLGRFDEECFFPRAGHQLESHRKPCFGIAGWNANRR